MSQSPKSDDVRRATQEIEARLGSSDFVLDLVNLFRESGNEKVRKLCCLFLMKAVPPAWEGMHGEIRSLVYQSLLEILQGTVASECGMWILETLAAIGRMEPETVKTTLTEVTKLAGNPNAARVVMIAGTLMSEGLDDASMEAVSEVAVRALESGDQEMIVNAMEFLRLSQICLQGIYSTVAGIVPEFHRFELERQKVVWCDVLAMIEREVFTDEELMVIAQSAFQIARDEGIVTDLRLLAMNVFESEFMLKIANQDMILQILSVSFDLAAAIVKSEETVPKEAMSVIENLFEFVDHRGIWNVLKAQVVECLRTNDSVRHILALTSYAIVCTHAPEIVKEDENLFIEMLRGSLACEIDLVSESGCNVLLALGSSSSLVMRYSIDLLRIFIPTLVRWLVMNGCLVSVGVEVLEVLVEACDCPCSGIVAQLWEILPQASENQLDVVNCIATALTLDRNLSASVQPSILQFVSEQLHRKDSELYGYSLVILAGLLNSDTFDFDPFELVGVERLGPLNVELTFIHNYTLAVHKSHADFLESQIPWLMSHLQDDWLDDRLTATTVTSSIIKATSSSDASTFYQRCLDTWDTEKPRTMDVYVNAIGNVVTLLPQEIQTDFLSLIFRCLDKAISDHDTLGVLCKAVYRVMSANVLPGFIPHIMSTLRVVMQIDVDEDTSRALRYLISSLWRTEFRQELFEVCVNNLIQERLMTRTDCVYSLVKLTESSLSEEEAITLHRLVTTAMVSHPSDNDILDYSILILSLLECPSFNLHFDDDCCSILLSWMQRAASIQCGYQELLHTISSIILRLSKFTEFPDDILVACINCIRTCSTKLASHLLPAISCAKPSDKVSAAVTDAHEFIQTLSPPALSRRRITSHL